MTTPADKLPASLPMETVELIADYQHRDEMRARIRAEMVQQKKVKLYMRASEAAIPAEQLVQELADALTRQETAQADAAARRV
jgi:hypothetical protein